MINLTSSSHLRLCYPSCFILSVFPVSVVGMFLFSPIPQIRSNVTAIWSLFLLQGRPSVWGERQLPNQLEVRSQIWTPRNHLVLPIPICSPLCRYATDQVNLRWTKKHWYPSPSMQQAFCFPWQSSANAPCPPVIIHKIYTSLTGQRFNVLNFRAASFGMSVFKHG